MTDVPGHTDTTIERTRLAWVRTSLGLVVVSLLATRLASEAGWAAVALATAGAAAAGLVAWRRSPVLLAAVVTSVAVAALVLVLRT